MSRTFLQRLVADQRGATVVEFAFVAPVLLMMVFGLFDLGHNMYTASMLQGAIQQAAREGTLEGASTKDTQLNALVTSAVRAIAPNAELQFQRKSYTSFSDVAQPEDFTDVDGNRVCNNGEPFEDANGNGTWDTDRGINGYGSARDAVLYTVTVTYPRMFPIARFIPGQTANFTMSSQTVLRNQPFSASAAATTVGNCP